MSGLQVAVDMQYELGGIDREMRAHDFVDLRFQPDPSVAV